MSNSISAVPVPAQRLAAAPVRAGRRPLLTLAGVLVMVTAAAGAGWAVLSAGDTVKVLALSRPVSAGHQISVGDLTYKEVDEASAGSALRSGDAATVVGQYAAVPLLKDQILVPGAVKDALTPAPGMSVVGVPVGPGQMPTTSVQAGDQVLLVSTPAEQEAPPKGAAPDSMTATVVSIDPILDTDKVVVNVQVRTDQAAMLAARAATGRIAIVQLAAGRD
jgi:hypothetical protein